MKNLDIDTIQRVSDVIAQERIHTTCRHIVSAAREIRPDTAQFQKIVDWFIEFDFYALQAHFALYDTNQLTISFTEGCLTSPTVFTVEFKNISEAYGLMLETMLMFEFDDIDEVDAEEFTDMIMTPMYRAISDKLPLLTRY